MERAGLLRVVAVDGELVPDVRRRLPGRGAYVHPDPACLDLAERRKAFPRALRATGPLDATRVRLYLRQAGRPGGTNGTASTTRTTPTGRGVDREAGRDSDERSMSTQP